MKKNYLTQKTEFVLELFFKQKYILFLVTLTLSLGNYSIAQTAGPNNAGTGANNAAIGTVAWTNPGNVTAADGTSTTAALTNGAFTNYIQGSNYGFAIPSGNVINGIEVIINRKTSANNGSRVTSDNIVKIVKNGSILGNNNAATGVGYPTTLTIATYGSPTDKWGLTWLASDINASNFGAALSVTANNNLTASVDYIQIKVYYTPSPTISSFTATSACIGSTPSIVITGNHFTGATNVSFNGVSAGSPGVGFVVNSNTQITATLPAGATTGTITVTTPSGTGTSVSNFTVNPLPVLNAITGTTSVCIGSTTTLSNSTSGGIWNSASTGVANISSGGVVSTVSAGTSLITYTYTNGNGCTNSVNTTVTVNALPVVSAASSVCIGSTIQLTPNSGGTWTSSDNAKATVDNTGLVNGVSVGSVTFTYTNSTTNCSKTTSAVNVLALPAISSQPTATQTVCSGSSVSFSVSATGAGLTYQWYNGATALNNGGNISGATSTTLTLNPVALGNASTNYNCIVTGTCTPTAPSANAELIVIEKVTITSQPVATQTLCNGNSAIFAVAATGTGISYQWYKGATALIDGGAISGATTNTLTISSLVISDAAANYYCLVSGTSPCSAVASSNSNLNVNQTVSITTHPQVTQTTCSAGSVSLSVSATGTGLSYQWYKGASPLSNGGSISGATSTTLTINPIALGNAGTDYYCVVSGTCAPSATSNNAEIIVFEKVAITSQPVASQTLCTGDTATFSVTASGSGLTYQWYKGATVLVDGGNIAGSTTDTLTLGPLVTGDAAANYHCVVSGTSPCSAVTSSNSNLNINQSASITTQPQVSQTICESGSVSLSVVATGGSLVYQWYKGATLLTNGGNISGATSATLTINPTVLGDSATDYNCVVSNGCSSGATSDNAEIIISPKAFIPAQTATTCSQSAFSLTPVNGVPNAATVVPSNTLYSWSAPSVTGGMTGGAAQSGQTSVFGTLTNPTNVNQTATYTVTPASGISPICSGASFTVTVSVEPKPYVQNATATVCSESSLTVSPTNGSGNIIPSGTLYSWGIPTVTGGITGATSGINQASIVQTLTNPTGVAQTATYTITPNSGNCSGNTFTLTVTVNPKPTTSINLATQTACSAIAFSAIVVTNTNNLATTYAWTRDNTTNVSGTTSGTSGTIAAGSSFSLSQILTNNTTTAQNVIFTFTPTTTGCAGNSVTSTVIVNPSSVGGTASSSLPGVTPVVRTITECHFATGTVYLSGYVGNIVRWEYTTTGGAIWLPIANTTASYTYANITQSTFFRAVVQNGAACNIAYSLATMVNVIPNIKPTPVTATPQTICVGDSSNLYSESGFATNSYIVTGGTFSNANPANWLVDGCGNCLNAGGSNTSAGPFRLSATNGGTYAGIDYASSGKFAIASGNYNSIMQTPIFNTFGLPSATLSFNHAFNLQIGASVSVELSLDGGATYTVVLAQYSGPATRTPYNAFPLETIDLSNYIGQANLRIRFVYNGNANSSWAIDNIIIPEAPSNLTIEWVDSSTGLVISNTATVTVSPIVTTTYAITSHLNGCTSFGPDGTTYITVTVNQRPTANISPSQTVCNGGTATFSVALTGVGPWSVTYSNGTTSTTVNNINTNPYVFSVPGITVNQTYTITALSDSKCTSKPQDLTGSAVVTTLNGIAGLWTGLVSTDWFDCKNWAGGLPSATINAQIPAGAIRMPIIDPATSSYASLYSNIARAQDVTIASNASVTMVNNSDLYVSRDWKNSGVFTPGQGTVTFNSSTLNTVQTINLAIKTNETFYNLTLNNSNSAKGISVADGFQLTVSNNLSLLSGHLRLVGEAQIVQNGTAANPSSGTGKILKDQQGNRSSYHYNYWTSPVTTNGTNYSISGILRDGTDSATNPFSPSAITFGASAYFADGAITTPVKLSSRWLFKYTSVSTVYAGWQAVGDTGTINIGEGFTMKGVTGIAPFTTPQNYVFVGKPNNGTIPLSIALNQSYLVGNPYPSALDADEFIKDNVKDGAGRAATNIFNGALYFWDHFGGQTHILSQYIGGYSSYTLMGGVVAISNDPLINADGSMGTKVPKRYIPVAQGFFIGTGSNSALTGNNPGLSTAVTGGTINFKNSQRTFKIESASNSVFFKSNVSNQTVNDTIDNRQKIRLLYQSPSNVYRQILVGADESTTSYFDVGYDAPIIDENAADLYWKTIDSKLIIQAVSNFNQDQILPLGLKTSTDGICTIKLDTQENISESIQLYIHDSETGYDYDIKNGDFAISLPIGIYIDRFSLRFAETALGTNNPSEIKTFATISNNVIKIESSEFIKEINLYDIAGKRLNTYSLTEIKKQFSDAFNYPNGIYIAKITLDNDVVVTKKLIH